MKWAVCAEPGCPDGKQPDSSYCPTHTAERAGQLQRRRRRDDRWVYNDPRWKRIRRQRLTIDPHCACRCGRPADTVDHITPIAQGGAPFDLNNTASYYRACHSRVTAQHDGGYGAPRRPGKPTPRP